MLGSPLCTGNRSFGAGVGWSFVGSSFIVSNNRSHLPAALRPNLLRWYDRHRRALPWRAEPGISPDPYHVWLSEIMLQQTTVATVKSYFDNFLARWPTVIDLAAASLDDVLHAWQGLGYYSRARNLHRCTGVVAGERDGRFPEHEKDLAKLPGIGDYTAAAIAAIAFGRPVVPVDGNAKRVIARMALVETSGSALKREVQEVVAALADGARPGDFAQALMDLGATVCRPRTPLCTACPWQNGCLARKEGRPERFPVPSPRKTKPVRFGVAFWLRHPDGAFWLRRRPENGLLGGMIEVPSTDWRAETWNTDEAHALAPQASGWRPLDGEVTHTFTHFHLRLSVWAGEAQSDELLDGFWCRPPNLRDHALPTVMKKVVRHALDRSGPWPATQSS